MSKKKFTGERLETFINSEVAVEHLHRYAIVLYLIANKRVLDIACGEGYGSNLMAGKASEVTGVDISASTIAKAQEKYKKSNLKFKEGSASEIPADDAYFDVVVSFETIEHHDKHDEMMSEIKRVLKSGGLVIISSPDKHYYTEKRDFHNQFHVKELYAQEFKTLIGKNFANSNFYNQRATFVSLLVPEMPINPFKEYKGDYAQVGESKEFGQLYNLAIASDGVLPEIYLSAFSDDELMHRLHIATINEVRSTLSYKIGHSILFPFKAIKNLIGKEKKVGH